MAKPTDDEDGDEGGSKPSARGGSMATFADMQLAGQARPAPPGAQGNEMQFLEAIPVTGGVAPPPPLYLMPQFNMGMQTPPPAASQQQAPTPANPNPMPSGGQQQMASQPAQQQQQQPTQQPQYQMSQPNIQQQQPELQSDSGSAYGGEFTQRDRPQQQTNQTGANAPAPSRPAPVGTMQPGGPNINPIPNNPAQMQPSMTTEQWGNYSPLQNMTEEQKKQYWAGQGTQGLAGMPGYQANQNGTYNAASNQQATQNYVQKNRADIDAITKAVQGGQQQALGQYNSGNENINKEQSAKDWEAAWAPLIANGSIKAAPPMPGQPAVATLGVGSTNGPTYNQGGPTMGGGTAGGAPVGGTQNGANNGGYGGVVPSGPGIAQTALGGSADPTIASILQDRMLNFNGGYQNPLQNEQTNMLRDMLQKPSAYDSDLFQQQYGMLKNKLDESYGLEKKSINEQGARRGLYDSSHVVGQLGDSGIQHDRAMTDMGTQLMLQRAQQLSGDRTNAVNAVNSFNQQGLNQFGANEAAMSGRVGQAMGYDNDLFNRSLSTAQFNNQQDQQQMDFWLKMLGY